MDFVSYEGKSGSPTGNRRILRWQNCLDLDTNPSLKLTKYNSEIVFWLLLELSRMAPNVGYNEDSLLGSPNQLELNKPARVFFWDFDQQQERLHRALLHPK